MTAMLIAACAMGAVLLVVAVTWWIDRPTPNEKLFDRAYKLGYSDGEHAAKHREIWKTSDGEPEAS